MSKTNKGGKRINKELKCEDLNRCVNVPIIELLTIIIEEFLQRRNKRYVEMNVQFFSKSKYPWLRKNRSLCSHFFAVTDSGYGEFEDLAPLHRNHSLHTIDTDLFKSENDDTSLLRKILLSQRLIIISAFIKYKP